MAAEQPIVSTPITDVAEPTATSSTWGTPEEFVAACERASGRPREDGRAGPRRMRRGAGRTSWDATAAAMKKVDSRRDGETDQRRG